MNLTYNHFIDNGIFVVANILNKDINQLSIEDFKNNIDKLVDVLIEKKEDENYRKLCEKAYTHNGCLTRNLGNGCTRKDVLKEKLSSWLTFDTSHSEDTCIICGEKRAVKEVQATRADIPGISSNTFLNYSNNLQFVNICPICMAFSLFFSLNAIKSSGDYSRILLINSDNKDLMVQWTNYLQTEFKYPEKKEMKKFTANVIKQKFLEWFVSRDTFSGYVDIIIFDNMGKSEDMKENFISARKVKFIYKLYELNLLDKLFDLGLMNKLFRNTDEDDYLDIFIDFTNSKYKQEFSQEILKILDKEVSLLEQTTLDLINNVSEKVFSLPELKQIETLQNIQNLTDFENIILRWQEVYKKTKNENLFESLDNFETLVNPRRWRSIKKRIICKFILLSCYE